jgi:RNA polymerase sigma factor (sigma-70 family)
MTSDIDDSNRAAMRQLLLERYDELRRRLARRLGSADEAHETLHELYLRIDRADAGVLQNPIAYLLASAINLARDRWRAENRRASRIDVDAVYEIIDENPGPDRVAEGRSTFEVLGRALEQLTRRQRDVLIAARYEGLMQAEIAARLGISERLVRLELQRALDYCQTYLAKNM